jgi:hypothetical protein
MNTDTPFKYAMTCVSGYWGVKNKHGGMYTNWFHNTLQINCPYVFFADKETIELIKTYRQTLPTYYVECCIEDFVTYTYKDRMITHPTHCPSVELNLIWNEKIFLIKKALELNPFCSDFFCWVDAGICTYRNKHPPNTPFPDIEKLKQLPKDKFIYSSSCPYKETDVLTNNYYHHISGTTYILHKNIIHTFTELYKNYLEKLVDTHNIWTDQVILTHIFKDHKYFFYKLCCGYGEIFPKMYSAMA